MLNEGDGAGHEKRVEDIPLEVAPIVDLLETYLGEEVPQKEDETVHMKRQIGLVGGISMIVGTMIGESACGSWTFFLSISGITFP